MDYRETYSIPSPDPAAGEQTTTEVITYTLDINVDVGIKEFRLAKNISGAWEEILTTVPDMTAERYVYDATDEIPQEEGGSPYRYFSYFTVRLYSYSDAEYINDTCIIWNVGGVIYTTATYGMLPWEFHVWESVVSSSWLYLLIHNPDVLFPKTLRQVYYMAKITNIHDEQ